MERSHQNLNKYINEFRYRHNMSNLLSERYRIPYKENSRAIDDKFKIIYFYQGSDGCEIMKNPSEAYEKFEITEKIKNLCHFMQKVKQEEK